MQTDIFSSTGLPVTLTPTAESKLWTWDPRKFFGLILATLAASSKSIFVATSTILTRVADTTTYASGDLVANSATAGSVVPIQIVVARKNAGVAQIRRVQLVKSGTVLTLASFRVHFYKTAPTVTNGDNGAWVSIRAGYLGSVDITVDKAFSDGAAGIGIPNTGTEISFQTGASVSKIYALIEARAAYVPPSAETFTLTVEGIQV